MLLRIAALAAALAPSALAWATAEDALKPLTISTDGIDATFIGYGARLQSLLVNDKYGKQRDIVVGYDDPVSYTNETSRNFFGAIVGRYANRIKNGTFTLGSETYHIPENEHDGLNTLHGGDIGYDLRNWTVVQYNTTAITYSLLDPDGFQGFPGILMNYVTYSVQSNPARLTTRIVSIPLDQATPAMLSTHIYWNLGGFAKPTILNDTLQMPIANRIIPIDGISIPTGELKSVKYPWADPPVPLNFTGERTIGSGAGEECGAGCIGIDNAFILDRPPWAGPESTDIDVLRWHSPDSGISMAVRTNQQALQVYNCVGQNGTVATKADQKQDGVQQVEQYGCLVIEPESWIDGINHPEWGKLDYQVFGPDTRVAENWAQYTFGTY